MEKMFIFVRRPKVTKMKHLTEEQGYAISVMWQNEFSKAKIASAIGVHKSTISRELQRNKDEKSGIYDWATAQRKSKESQQARVRFHRLTDEMHEAIVTKLSMDWSPEQISGDCRVRGIDYVSHETIYRMIWKDKEEGGTMYTHLRRKGRKKANRGLKNQYKGMIPNRVDIDGRPSVVDEKTRFGDLEDDTIIGKNHKGAIVTINDRLTGFSWSAQLEDKGADNVADAIIQMLMPFKGYLHTLTFDNGREFAHHKKVSEALGISIFFAKPYHSWERGANENTNGLYRQYIPKGTDFHTLDKDVLPTARLMLNTRPRKKLNFISPIQEIYRIFASDFNLINIVNKVAFVT